MASKSDSAFLNEALRRGWLRAEDVELVLKDCERTARFFRRPVPVPHILFEHAWLAPDRVDELCNALRRRILLCEACWARLNVHGVAPGNELSCGHCHARLRMPNSPLSGILHRAEPGAGEAASNPASQLPADSVAEGPSRPSAEPSPAGPWRTRSFLPGFEPLDLLRESAQGSVWKARQLRLDRVVVVKLLNARVADKAASTQRFLREARALGRIDHPGVVRLYHFGTWKEALYLLFKWEQGRTLDEFLSDGARLPPERALEVAADVSSGLMAAHDAQVVHRDVNPANIILRPDGTACLMGFGSVLLLDGQGTRITGPNELLGPRPYTAPEQLQDPHAALVGSDVYSVGATLHYMLYGEPPRSPMRGAGPRAGVSSGATLPAQAGELGRLLLAMLAPLPEQRPSLAVVLEGIQDAAIALSSRAADRPPSKDTSFSDPE
ncbi:MAG: serine/threonine protein kinase [Planctomycetes bacterium]|nr:serine/threonine protein kinase [Planctomycetota bacterium]